MFAAQSVARTFLVGPILDADGAAVTSALTATDVIKVTKNGTVGAADAQDTLTHDHTGHYKLVSDGGDFDTLGEVEFSLNSGTNAMAPVKFQVVPLATYNALMTAAGTAGGISVVETVDGKLGIGAHVRTLNENATDGSGAARPTLELAQLRCVCDVADEGGIYTFNANAAGYGQVNKTSGVAGLLNFGDIGTENHGSTIGLSNHSDACGERNAGIVGSLCQGSNVGVSFLSTGSDNDFLIDNQDWKAGVSTVLGTAISGTPAAGSPNALLQGATTAGDTLLAALAAMYPNGLYSKGGIYGSFLLSLALDSNGNPYFVNAAAEPTGNPYYTLYGFIDSGYLWTNTDDGHLIMSEVLGTKGTHYWEQSSGEYTGLWVETSDDKYYGNAWVSVATPVEPPPKIGDYHRGPAPVVVANDGAWGYFGPVWYGCPSAINPSNTPCAVYSAAANKTFFSYGKNSYGDGIHPVVGYYDHATELISVLTTIGGHVAMETNVAESNVHGNPVLVIDGDGYLWCFYGCHTRPIYYRRSVRPYDPTEWSDEYALGDLVTYRYTYVNAFFANGRIYIITVCQTDSPERIVLLSCDPDTSGEPVWSDETVIATPLGPFIKAAFNDYDNTIHLFFSTSGRTGATWRAAFQDVNYMKSADYGVTWTKANGTAITLPATELTADYCYNSTGVQQNMSDYVILESNPFMGQIVFENERVCLVWPANMKLKLLTYGLYGWGNVTICDIGSLWCSCAAILVGYHLFHIYVATSADETQGGQLFKYQVDISDSSSVLLRTIDSGWVGHAMVVDNASTDAKCQIIYGGGERGVNAVSMFGATAIGDAKVSAGDRDFARTAAINQSTADTTAASVAALATATAYDPPLVGLSVTGDTSNPRVDGTYRPAGAYNGRTYYESIDLPLVSLPLIYLWYRSHGDQTRGRWILSATLGDDTGPYYYLSEMDPSWLGRGQTTWSAANGAAAVTVTAIPLVGLTGAVDSDSNSGALGARLATAASVAALTGTSGAKVDAAATVGAFPTAALANAPTGVQYNLSSADIGEVPHPTLVAYKGNAISWSVTCATSQTGKTHLLSVYALTDHTTALWTILNAAIAVSDTILTITATDAVTGTAGTYWYKLENTTDDLRIADGTLQIEA